MEMKWFMSSFMRGASTYFFVLSIISPFISKNGVISREVPYNVSNIGAVFVFGDSLVDTGNNNWLPTLAKGNSPQNGKNFMGGKPNGRFSDGKIPSDILVEELGIKELLPPYLDPTLTDDDLITGVNFASSASGYDPQTGALLQILSIQKQLELFEEYTGKLKGIVGEKRALEILSKSLFIVCTGHNDIQLNPSLEINPSYTQTMVKFASTFLQELYKLGARRIDVFGVIPLGCVPFQRNTLGGGKCLDSLNRQAQLFNTNLSAEINSLTNTFHGAKMVYVDLYYFVLDLIHNPIKYGYKIVENGCCAVGGRVDLGFCPVACENDYDYLFWDGFHFTEKSYRIIVHHVLHQHFTSFIS